MKQIKYKCLLLLMAALCCIGARGSSYDIDLTNLQPIIDIDFSNAIENNVIKGTAGSMTISEDSEKYPFELGYTDSSNELLLGDVLRVGNGNAIVDLPIQGVENTIIRVQFDLWVSFIKGHYFSINLNNVVGDRVAGFSYDHYVGSVAYNSFNNNANEGLDLHYVSGIGSPGDNTICVDENKSSFDLILNYKDHTIQGIVKNGKNGICVGKAMPMNELEDLKVAQFVLSSDYTNLTRRCWFDNLKVYQYSAFTPEESVNYLSYDYNKEHLTATVTGIEEGSSENLSELKIPSANSYGGSTYTVTSIGEYAFFEKAFSTIILPATIETIGAGALYVFDLADVYCHATKVPELGEEAFLVNWDTDKVPATLHVPASVLEAYKSADGWKDFQRIVAIAEPEVPAPVAVKTEVDYFINTDTGLGTGTLRELSLNEEEEQTLSIPETELKFGLNILGLRLKTTFDNGSISYSSTTCKYVYRYHPQDAWTYGYEYFIGKDPGIGKATRIVVEGQAEEYAHILSETELKYGLNTFGIRLISSRGNEGEESYSYSPTVLHNVYRYHAQDAHTIGVEYALNGGKPVFVSCTGDEVSFAIDKEQMRVGINVLALRPVSENSETGVTYGATRYQYVYRPAAEGERPVEYAEYFWDEDPGKGLGTPLTITNVDGQQVVNSEINYRGIYGAHILNIRIMSRGIWSAPYQQAVILPAGTLSGELTLDPEVEEDTDNGKFRLLSTLLGALSTRGFDIGLNVNVSDATYNFVVSEQSIAVVQALYKYLIDMNFYISMKAKKSATFNFIMPEEFIYTHQSELPQIVAAVQAMFSHIVTENISILINGQAYQYDGFQVEPNDLLALKNIYNRLNGENWTQKKWSFVSNGREKNELPGVEFNEQGRVTSINLSGNNLIGKLTKDWNLVLPYLTSLDLSNNTLTGDLSPLVSELSNLTSLNVSFNCLTEISSPLPSGLLGMDESGLERQFFTYRNPFYIYTLEADYIREELESTTPILVYFSQHQKITLPTFFTYNVAKGDYSTPVRISTAQGSGTSVLGYNNTSNDYYFSPGNLLYVDYNQPQDYVITMCNQRGAIKARLRYLMGDADFSGATDVLDVQLTLNRILGSLNRNPFNYAAANTYIDETINVQDIVCTVNIVLDNEAKPEENIYYDFEEGATLDSRAMTNKVKAWLYTQNNSLMLAADDEVGALDVELTGVSTSQVSLLLNHNQFQMIGRNTKHGSRYVIFSPTGKPIPAGEVTSLLKISGNGIIASARLSDMNAKEMTVSISQQPTDIAALLQGSGLSASFVGDKLVLKATKEMTDVDFRLTTTGGATVMSTRLNHVYRGETTVDVHLQAGIYILEMTSKDGFRKIVKLMKR